jgi:hypothetical protein
VVQGYRTLAPRLVVATQPTHRERPLKRLFRLLAVSCAPYAYDASAQVDEFRAEIAARLTAITSNFQYPISTANVGAALALVQRSASCSVPPDTDLIDALLTPSQRHELRHELLNRSIACRHYLVSLKRLINSALTEAATKQSNDANLLALAPSAPADLLVVRTDAAAVISQISSQIANLDSVILSTKPYYNDQCVLYSQDIEVSQTLMTASYMLVKRMIHLLSAKLCSNCWCAHNSLQLSPTPARPSILAISHI